MTRNSPPDGCSTRFRRQLDRYLDGDLPPRQQQRLRQHLQACDCCRRHLHELAAVRALLKQSPEIVPPRSFTLTERDLQAYRRVLWYPILRSATAVIAALVLATFLAGLLLPGLQAPPAPTPRAIGVKPSPLTTPSPQAVAVAPAITQRVPPTGLATPGAGITSETAYPLKPSPWIRATVPRPVTPAKAPDQAAGLTLWQTINLGGLLLLGLIIGLTWLAYRRERVFFT